MRDPTLRLPALPLPLAQCLPYSNLGVTTSTAVCTDTGSDCCASQKDYEWATCQTGYHATHQPQGYSGCPNYRCVPSPSGFYANADQNGVCAQGSYVATQAECQAAAVAAGLPWNGAPQLDCQYDYPTGCFFFNAATLPMYHGFYWNGNCPGKTWIIPDHYLICDTGGSGGSGGSVCDSTPDYCEDACLPYGYCLIAGGTTNPYVGASCAGGAPATCANCLAYAGCTDQICTTVPENCNECTQWEYCITSPDANCNNNAPIHCNSCVGWVDCPSSTPSSTAKVTMEVYTDSSCSGTPTGTHSAEDGECVLAENEFSSLFGWGNTDVYLGAYSSGYACFGTSMGTCTGAMTGGAYQMPNPANGGCGVYGFGDEVCSPSPTLDGGILYVRMTKQGPLSTGGSGAIIGIAAGAAAALLLIAGLVCLKVNKTRGGGGGGSSRPARSYKPNPVAQTSTSAGMPMQPFQQQQPVAQMPFQPVAQMPMQPMMQAAPVMMGTPMPQAAPMMFDPNTGAPLQPQAPAGGNRFDPNTGQELPKFDPLTGKQNW